MLSLIEDEIVNKKKWLDHEEFLDGMAIAQSTPGVLAVNISLITGYKIAGFSGMIVGMLGAVLPSFFIVLFLKKSMMPVSGKITTAGMNMKVRLLTKRLQQFPKQYG